MEIKQFANQCNEHNYLSSTAFTRNGRKQNYKALNKKYMALKDKEVYAIFRFKSQTIYYNLLFAGDTKLYLYYK